MVKNEIFGLDFKDKRLNNRFEKIFIELEKDSKSAFPGVAKNWAWLKGLYRFFDNKKITRENMIKTHIQNTVDRCMTETTVPAIQDTTSICFTGSDKIEGLGYIDDKEKKKGFLVHSVMAVSGETGKPPGILNQQIIVRRKFYPGEESYATRLKRKRESDKWTIGLRETQKLLSGHAKVLHVSDRESDIYFHIKNIIDSKDGFVIRACRNRSTEDGYLFDSIKEAEHKGCLKIDVSRKGGRKGRKANVSIYSRRLTIMPPKVVNHIGDPIDVNLVYVLEKKRKKDKLEWIVFTSEPVNTLEECEKVIWYYKNRWQIEDFHKGLKTGCSIEKRQLGTRTQHEKLLSMFSILAWHGLLLRHNARTSGNQELTLNSLQVQILKQQYPNQKIDADAQSILKAVAMLGGFIGRKSDGNPGWRTILSGLTVLEYLKQGVLLGKNICG